MTTMPTTGALKRALTIASFTLVAAVGAAVLRAQPAAPSRSGLPTRVAIVNFAKIMDGLTEAKDTKMRLEAMVADSKKQLDDINAQLKKLDSDLELLKDKKETPEYRAQVGKKLVLASQGQALQTVLQRLIDEQEGATVRTMYLKVIDAVQKVAARDGWDVVLKDDREIVPPERKKRDNSPLTGDEVRVFVEQRSILTANPAIEISQAVLDQMNNDYKAAKH